MGRLENTSDNSSSSVECVFVGERECLPGRCLATAFLLAQLFHLVRRYTDTQTTKW